jgi:peroxiredoxin family protein
MAEKVTIIIFSDDLDKACAALNIAIGSAASGKEVILFFTCWGVNLVKKEEGPTKGDTLVSKLLNKMMNSGPKKLSPSRFNFLGIGGWLMRREMAIKKMQSIPEKMEVAKELGVRFLICDQPMTLMGLKREDLINDVEKIVGIGTYVKEAAESQVNLVF